MKKFILSTAALATLAVGGITIGGIAVAQGGGKMAPPATKAEATAQVAERFAKLDADGNGQVTATEMTGHREARMEKREARMEKRAERIEANGGKRLARVDTDGNGQISLAEMSAQAAKRFDRMDANKDGTVDATERAAMRENRKERRAARMAN